MEEYAKMEYLEQKARCMQAEDGKQEIYLEWPIIMFYSKVMAKMQQVKLDKFYIGKMAPKGALLCFLKLIKRCFQ